MRTNGWIRLLVILTVAACGCLKPAVLAAAEKGPEIKFFYPKQVLRGEATEITVVGWDFKGIQSVEVTPSEGVSVRAIKEDTAVKWGARSKKMWPWSKAERAWTLEMVVGLEAQPGDRSVVVVTPQGRLAPQTIRIPNHIPRITEVKVLSAKPAGKDSEGAVEFEATVFDEAGDLGSEPHIMVAILCGREERHESLTVVLDQCPFCSPPRARSRWELAWRKVTKVTAKDSTNAVVYVSENLRRPMPGEIPFARRNETCEMQTSIQDQNGNISKNVSTPVEFK